jgi:hypothetical protein
MTDAFNTFTDAISGATATVNTAPPGAVQSGIDYDALVTAVADFALVGADAVNVFAEDFQAIILEALSAGILAAGIIGDIEGIPKPGVVSSVAPAVAAAGAQGGAAAPAATVTASSVLAQVQQQATTNLTLLNTVFQDAKSQGQYANLPAGFEAQFLGGQILFQQDINAFLNSLPSSLSPTNDSNQALIAVLQNLLLIEQDLNNTLSQIDTYDNLEQPIQLTVLNVVVLLDDAVILTEASLVGFTYAAFALEALTGELVTVTATGAYSVPIPSGATFVDIVLSAGAGGGGGYNTAGSGTGGTGGDTTATPTGGSTLTAAGGTGGASSTSSANSAGGSPGNESFDGQTYDGGTGGAAGNNSAGGNGTAPGGGGGGGGAFGSYGGQGGSAGAWAAETIAITSGMTEITGTVGAGGTAGAASAGVNAPGGTGGHGSAFFFFYS